MKINWSHRCGALVWFDWSGLFVCVSLSVCHCTNACLLVDLLLMFMCDCQLLLLLCHLYVVIFHLFFFHISCRLSSRSDSWSGLIAITLVFMLMLAHMPRDCVSVCTGTCDCIWTCDCDWTCDYVCHVTGLVIVTVLAPALVLLVIVPSLVLIPVIVLVLAPPCVTLVQVGVHFCG